MQHRSAPYPGLPADPAQVTMPVHGPLCPAVDIHLCLDSFRGCYRVQGCSKGLGLSPLQSQVSQGWSVCLSIGKLIAVVSPGRRGPGFADMINLVVSRDLGQGGSSRAKPPLNVLTWLTTRGGAGSGRGSVASVPGIDSTKPHWTSSQ